MKTSELTGPTLDWAVAMCELPTNSYGWLGMAKAHQYSANWAQGGPIIERELIDVFRNYEERCWQAEANRYAGCLMARGETPLIAAMRCYVASKLGDKVEVPEELK